VSVTFDGVPLNDSGNYALFTNQMLDSELVDRVDVNLGTTDVDSPTASATGGTVRYKTKRPNEEFGGEVVASAGEFDYKRGFFRLDSGAFGPWGTKAFLSGSYQNYDKFKGPGELEKKQVNAVIRQDFENENFISVAFHYNENRNAFYRTTSAANYALYGRDYDNLDVCTRDFPTTGTADNDNASPVATIPGVLLNTDNPANTSSCTNYYGVRINPSNTGNVRIQSLWHLGEKMIFTFDPSYQYTLANGGGTTALAETVTRRPPTCASAAIRAR
jgi:iron complex outermembrane receptor protein